MVQVKVGLARGEIEEINTNSDDDNPKAMPSPLKEMIEACWKLEENSLLVYTEDVLDLVQAVHQYQGHLQRISREMQNRPLLIYSSIASRFRTLFSCTLICFCICFVLHMFRGLTDIMHYSHFDCIICLCRPKFHHSQIHRRNKRCLK